MGMSTHVVGFRPVDEKWKRMAAVWHACEHAGIAPPKEVQEFFGDANPDEDGVAVDIEGHICCDRLNDSEKSGFVVDVTKLPKGVTILRFYNSY